MESATHAIAGSGVGRVLRESLWAYPVTETVHIVALAALVGSVLVVDLRLLGLSRSVSVARLARHALPWTVGAFLVVVLSGVTMFTAHPDDFLENRVFMLKMALIAAAGANAGLLHFGEAWRKLSDWDTEAMPPPVVRVSAALSLLFWVAVIACGRMLAYT